MIVQDDGVGLPLHITPTGAHEIREMLREIRRTQTTSVPRKFDWAKWIVFAVTVAGAVFVGAAYLFMPRQDATQAIMKLETGKADLSHGHPVMELKLDTLDEKLNRQESKVDLLLERLPPRRRTER